MVDIKEVHMPLLGSEGFNFQINEFVCVSVS